MLDLNLDIISSDSSCDENNRADTTMEIGEASGTSTSSIIITEEALTNAGDENSSNITAAPAFIFDILRRENIEESKPKETNPYQDFTTHHLFPERTGLGLNLRPGFGVASKATSQWLKLSHQVGLDGEGEMRILQQNQQPLRKSRRGPRSRSSQYRGVTFYRRTGRWESHIWDCGKQVYLGGFDTAHAAARAYDRAAIKFRGAAADINFNLSDYEEDMKQMKSLGKEEFVQILRRRSTGFPRGSSKNRSVSLHKCDRWEAPMGQQFKRSACDKAAITWNEREAVTNNEREIVFNPHEGVSHNLDLSLGIFVPSNDTKGNNNVEECHSHCAACEMPNKVRPLAGDAAFASTEVQALHDPPIKSNILALCYGIYPSLSSKHEESDATEKRVEAASSLRFSSWAWQTNGNNNNNKGVNMSKISVAASSGFASSTVTASPATVPLKQQQPNHSVKYQCIPRPTNSHHRSNYHKHL